MKVLIVDNGTRHLQELQKLVTTHTFETIPFSKINKDTTKFFDAVILSGGYKFPVMGNESLLKKEIDFIETSEKPIFGICFGFELIAMIFGAKLKQMDKKEKGIIDIEILKPGGIFSNIPNFKVFESHRWVIETVGSQLVGLAKSKDGIEAIQHKTRPIYGVQFHPEMFVEKTCGDEIFNNFLDLIKKEARR